VSSENKGMVVSTLLGHHDQMGYVLWVTIQPLLPSDWPGFTELHIPRAFKAI